MITTEVDVRGCLRISGFVQQCVQRRPARMCNFLGLTQTSILYPRSKLATSPLAGGMSDIAKATGITREALYKALRPNSKPHFNT